MKHWGYTQAHTNITLYILRQNNLISCKVVHNTISQISMSTKVFWLHLYKEAHKILLDCDMFLVWNFQSFI